MFEKFCFPNFYSTQKLEIVFRLPPLAFFYCFPQFHFINFHCINNTNLYCDVFKRDYEREYKY